MTVVRWIRLIAGSFILISLALAVWVNIHWLWFTAFVGANLLQCGYHPLVPDGSHHAQAGLSGRQLGRPTCASMP